MPKKNMFQQYHGMRINYFLVHKQFLHTTAVPLKLTQIQATANQMYVCEDDVDTVLGPET